MASGARFPAEKFPSHGLIVRMRLRAAFVERLCTWLGDEEMNLWYLDEMGVEGDPRPRRRYIRQGRERAYHQERRPSPHERQGWCVHGPECSTLWRSLAQTRRSLAFLEHANRDPDQQAQAQPADLRQRILAQASTGLGPFRAHLPATFSPDLNPIERLWLLIKSEWFTDFVAARRRPNSSIGSTRLFCGPWTAPRTANHLQTPKPNYDTHRKKLESALGCITQKQRQQTCADCAEDELVPKALELVTKGRSCRQIARKLSINKSTVGAIVARCPPQAEAAAGT